MRTGNSAVTYDAGVSFRVWAPHASSVSVSPYSSNSRWGITAMTKESNGTFYVNVGNAQPGDTYVYNLDTPYGLQSLNSYVPGSFVRLDPRAQDIDPTRTTGWHYSVVHDPSYSWKSNPISIPANQLVIYELHIPTFNSAGAIGTFATAIEKLPFLKSLGINAVELMPIGTSIRNFLTTQRRTPEILVDGVTTLVLLMLSCLLWEGTRASRGSSFSII